MADSTHDIPQIDTDTAEIEVTVNEINLAQSPALAFGIKSIAALHVELYEGYALDSSGTPVKITSGLGHDLTNAATNYLSLEPGAPPIITRVTSAPSGWPGPLASGGTALLSFVCAGGAITGHQDYRMGSTGGVTRASVLAALDIDSWTWVGDELTIVRNGKQYVIEMETP